MPTNKSPQARMSAKNAKRKRKAEPTANSGKTVELKKPAGRTENLRPWGPGQSGNPSGRPKTAALSQAIRKKLTESVPDDPEGRTYAEVIADTLAQRALDGDIQAAREMADRAEGKPRQSLEIEHTSLRQSFERMSQDELETYVRTGQLPSWWQHGQDEHGTIN